VKKIRLSKYKKVAEYSEGFIVEVFYCSNNLEVRDTMRAIRERGNIAVRG
jgi:transcriptional regulator of NAD metabolism